jgi:hypothetical protein
MLPAKAIKAISIPTRKTASNSRLLPATNKKPVPQPMASAALPISIAVSQGIRCIREAHQLAKRFTRALTGIITGFIGYGYCGGSQRPCRKTVNPWPNVGSALIRIKAWPPPSRYGLVGGPRTLCPRTCPGPRRQGICRHTPSGTPAARTSGGGVAKSPKLPAHVR